MEIKEIAEKLVNYCNAGDYESCYQELYSPEIVSIEPDGAMHKEVKGFEGIKMKGKAWNDMVEQVFSAKMGDIIIGDGHFAVTSSINLKYKGAPGPIDFKEICVYQVKDGKIVKEQFFYS